MARTTVPPLAPLLRDYDQLILDLDGCVWVGDEPVDGSVEAIATLREAGKRVAFATNNSWQPGEDHVAKLWSLGVKASLADVVTVGGAMQHLLAETRSGRTAFVIGTAALRRHVEDAGLKVLNGTDLASRADVVVVGGTDEFSYAHLRDATLAVHRGADLLATGRDPSLPMPDGPWPGTGALLAAVETASGRGRRDRGQALAAAVPHRPGPPRRGAHAGGRRPPGLRRGRRGGRRPGRGARAQRRRPRRAQPTTPKRRARSRWPTTCTRWSAAA